MRRSISQRSEPTEQRDAEVEPGRLILIVGLPGSGKTTLAVQLAESLGAVRMCPDDWMMAAGIDMWDAVARARIEAAQRAIALDHLRAGLTVVVEWGLWSRGERDDMRDAAWAVGARVELRALSAGVDELWRRIRARDLEGRFGLRRIERVELERWAGDYEAPTADELATYDESGTDSFTASQDGVLAGGTRTEVHRVGDVVLRAAGPQSTAVMALLAHLRDAGFGASPRPVGTGFTEDGREQLTFVSGESPHPRAWSEAAAGRLGLLVRELHDATRRFELPPAGRWRPWFARDLPGDHPVVGHGDLGPWNVIAVGGEPVAFIDWENAGPVDAVWELAQVAWLNAHLYDEDVAERVGLPDLGTRVRHCAAILDGYGLERAARDGFVDRMIEFAVRSARDEAVQYAVRPETVSPAEDGFPVLWGITWRARSAAWMLDHRADIQRAIER